MSLFSIFTWTSLHESTKDIKEGGKKLENCFTSILINDNGNNNNNNNSAQKYYKQKHIANADYVNNLMRH
jgi:hypothetical protein